MAEPIVACCLKPVERRQEVDPLTGEYRSDPLSAGLSPADEAALEWAVRSAARDGARLRLVTAGGEEADALLRAAGAAAGGTAELVRVPLEPGAPSERVAAGLAPACHDASVVWCGDMSLDRGSGAVPAFLAGLLGAAQALGLVAVDLGEVAGGPIGALRRLERGRRERLSIVAPAVCSVEGGTAELRRAPLGALLAAPEVPVALSAAPPERGGDGLAEAGVGPYRPRTRVVPPPDNPAARERVRALVGLDAEPRVARAVTLEPAAAAAAILEALKAWGER